MSKPSGKTVISLFSSFLRYDIESAKEIVTRLNKLYKKDMRFSLGEVETRLLSPITADYPLREYGDFSLCIIVGEHTFRFELKDTLNMVVFNQPPSLSAKAVAVDYIRIVESLVLSLKSSNDLNADEEYKAFIIEVYNRLSNVIKIIEDERREKRNLIGKKLKKDLGIISYK